MDGWMAKDVVVGVGGAVGVMKKENEKEREGEQWLSQLVIT